MLNFGFWNIHGLNKTKISDDDFITYVNNFDIVAFAETLVSESPGDLPEFSKPFTVAPTKRKRRGV